MKRLITQALLLLSVFAFTKAGADDRWETLRAIHWVENPTNQTRVGRYGELGPYQFRPATWRMHTSKPFRQAIDQDTADEVAVKHYEWIKQKLVAAGVAPTSYNIAMAWNTGVDNVVNGRVPSVSYNYAERVVNLVHSIKRNRPRKAAPEPVAVAEEETMIAQAPMPSLELDGNALHFSSRPDAPKFEIVVAADEPEAEFEEAGAAPLAMVYTEREPAMVTDAAAPAAVAPATDEVATVTKPLFVVTTTATLTPRFSLFPNLTD